MYYRSKDLGFSAVHRSQLSYGFQTSVFCLMNDELQKIQDLWDPGSLSRICHFFIYWTGKHKTFVLILWKISMSKNQNGFTE